MPIAQPRRAVEAPPREAKPRNPADALILDHFALVRRLAWHVHGKVGGGAELEELVQAGTVALVEAARTYEDVGYAFSTYASLRIKGAMIDHMRRLSGRSRTSSATRRTLAAARQLVESSTPGPASAAAIARQLGVTPQEHLRMESDAGSGGVESLDDCYAEDNPDFCDASERADDGIDRVRREERLRDALAALDARSQLVLKLYFFEEFNLDEIGRTLNLGAARVCQIKKAALTRLRAMHLVPDFMM